MTFTIVPMNYNPRRSRVTRRTLNVLKILTALNAETALLPPDIKTISKIDKDTINPSNMFILSLTYPNGVNPMTFKLISAMKIYEKI